MYFNIEINVLD